MNEQSVFALMKDWGYYPVDKSHPDSLGYTGLMVAIRKEPTGNHFDPQALHLCLQDEYGLARGTTLSMLSPPESTGHVCPGIIRIQDRTDKRVHFYTFGGSLEMAVQPDEMMLTFHSPAPILELGAHPESVQNQIAAEAGEMLAEIEVKWGFDERAFNRRLAGIDPFQFYLAIMQSLLDRYARVRALKETEHALHQALQREKDWLVSKHQWPAKPPSIEGLFAHS